MTQEIKDFFRFQTDLLTELLQTRLGYDDSEVRKFAIDANGELYVHLDARDDFQNELPIEHQIRNGAFQAHRVPDWSIYTLVEEWPTREERELRVKARQLAEFCDDTQGLKSLYVQEFVSRLKPELDELRMALPAT